MGDEYGAETGRSKDEAYDESGGRCEICETKHSLVDYNMNMNMGETPPHWIIICSDCEHKANYGAENFNAYTTRFSPKNPNTRSKMVSRGRRIVQDDPEYQQFRKYSFAGLGILGLGIYLFARKSNSDNDSNNG